MKKLLLKSVVAAAILGSLTAMAVSVDISSGLHQPVGPAAADNVTYTPDDVSDLKVVWDPGESGFVISFVAPSRASYTDYSTWEDVYTDLTDIDRIEVGLDNGYYQDMTLLHTFTNPQPGDPLSYCEMSLEAGKDYTFKVVVYACGTESYGATSPKVKAGAYPDVPTDVTVSTVKGQMPVTVTFTAPSNYEGFDIPLPSLSKAVLETEGGWYTDGEQLAELTAIEPGKSYSMTVNKPDITGKQTWKLKVYTTDVFMSQVDVPLFIGVDTPGTVNDLAAYEQDNDDVLISWSAPDKGANNGYFESDGISYVVKKIVDGNSSVIADNLTETSYTYPVAGMTEPQLVGFTVTPVSAAGDGKTSAKVELIAGPALSLPFSETFDTKVSDYTYGNDHLWATSTDCTESYPPSWRTYDYVYAGNVQVKPESGEGALIYISPYSSTPVSNFYLTSCKINVAGEEAVELAYSCYVPDAVCGATSLTSEISFDKGKTFTTVRKSIFDEIETKGWNKMTETVVVPSGADTALLRFVAFNDPTALPVILDNVSLKSTSAPQVIYPASVTDFTAEYNKAEKFIALSMKAPLNSHATLGDINNYPLESITEIKISRQIGYGNDYIDVYTFTNPVPGETLTWNDTDLDEYGEYRYRALVYIDDHCDFGNYPDNDITIGQIPRDVTDVKATTSKGSAPVVISFTAPAEDVDGEPLEALKGISVTRYDSDTFVWDEIESLEDVEPGKQYSVTDSDVLSGNTYEYRVKALGTAGDAYGTSVSVYVGIDNPTPPANVVARLDNDGKVLVTWDAPQTGVNGGYIDTEHLTYIVLRGNGYSDYNAVQLASGVADTKYVDDTVFNEEAIVKYFVKAVSNDMTGYSEMSNKLLVGPANSLPFVENFEKQVGDLIEADHTSWSLDGSDETCNWAFAEMAYFIYEGQVTPVQGGHGLAYAHYGPYSSALRDDYMTSGNIDVSEVDKVYVSYYMYAVPGYNTALNVGVSFDGGIIKNIKSSVYSDFGEQGWQHIEIPVDKPAGAKKMQVQFHAHKDSYSCSVAIDNVKVDSKSSGINGVEVNKGVLVAAVDGTIVVRGADASRIVIADMQGNIHHAGQGDCEVRLATGTYIVRVDATSVKLMVR